MQPTTWTPAVRVTDDEIGVDDLRIRFHRTIPVPDNDDTHALPPSLGYFPLYKTGNYAEKLPLSMAQKGGVFFPMYRTLPSLTPCPKYRYIYNLVDKLTSPSSQSERLCGYSSHRTVAISTPLRSTLAMSMSSQVSLARRQRLRSCAVGNFLENGKTSKTMLLCQGRSG